MKLGRNQPCHCGSGKKYKVCCLPKDQSAEAKNELSDCTVPLLATAPSIDVTLVVVHGVCRATLNAADQCSDQVDSIH